MMCFMICLKHPLGDLGICLDDTHLGILLYTDNLILLAESELDLQNMINLVSQMEISGKSE